MNNLSVHKLAVPNTSCDHLGDFGDEELELLLQCYEEETKRSTFIKHRSSVISGTSIDGMYKKAGNESKEEHDELKDVRSKLETLQNVLKYVPPEIMDLNRNDPMSMHHDEAETRCSGFLVIVGGNIAEASRFYVELIVNTLYLRREPNSKIKQIICISFIDSNEEDEKERKKSKHLADKKEKRIENGKYCDLFLAHLESRSSLNSFKIYSPSGIYVISASCDTDRERFCRAIESELLSLFSNETWFAKIEAAKQLLPMERSEFEIQMERHEQIMNSLTLTGLAHNMGLLGSTNKDKSGVMRILKNNNDNKKHKKWEDHFFVLSHQTLYYFYHDPETKTHKNRTQSKCGNSSMPKSFISLKYATLDLDIERIKSDRFVFYISTPLRCIYLRCRHPVALSEWISALSNVMETKSNESALDILCKIRKIRSKVSTLNNLLKFKAGMQLFADYLKENECENVLRCWLEILHYKKENKKEDDDDDEKEFIYRQYLNDDSKECIWHKFERDSDDDNLSFDEISQMLFNFLNFEFETNFIKRNDYLQLKNECDSRDKYLPMPLNREIGAFCANAILILNISSDRENIANSNKNTATEIKLSRKKKIASIGRDCSNDIVLDDSHVSRSHARIQYDENGAYFTDLGSHHGSYLNGSRVLSERLANNDVIKIGQSLIRFQVKNKTNIINKVFQKILSSNNLNLNKNSNQSKKRDTISGVAFM